MPKKALVKLQYIKAIQISADRGKAKQCQLCMKDFSMFTKEHQCKRCKRAVCEGCSPHKAVVQKYDDQKGHRQCNFCKMESDGIKKFVIDNRLEFLRDTLSKQWLKSYDLDVNTANKDYQQACDEAPKAKDDKELVIMRSQIQAVYMEINDWQNYSLREFFTTMQLDQGKASQVIERVLVAFLSKFPEVGWSPDLVLMLQYFLCFASESVAYMLLTIVYGSIIPSYLYNRTLRTKPYEYGAEIDMIMLTVDQGQGLRMQTPEANALKYLLQATLQKYIPSLSVNFLLAETTFFVINQMFQGGNEGYDELIKSLVSVFASQAQEIKKLGVKYDEAELSIMKNVKSQQASSLYLQMKKVSLDEVKQKTQKSKEQAIMSRSVSVAQEKQQAQLNEKEQLRFELQNIGQRNTYLQSQNESMLSELTNLRQERKSLLAKQQISDEELKSLNEKYEQLLEESQSLKLEKLKREAQEYNQSPSAQTQELEQQILDLNTLTSELNGQLLQSAQTLDEERKLRLQATEQLDYSKKSLVQLKSQLDEFSKKIIEKDSSILKLKGEMEFLTLQMAQNETPTSNSNQSDQNINVIQQKNVQINKLTAELQGEVSRVKQLQEELKQSQDMTNQFEKNIQDNLKEIQLLEREIVKLKSSERSGLSSSMVQAQQPSVSMSVILKDLEDSKTLMEKKNGEIISLKKQIKEQEEQLNTLNNQVRNSKSEMAKQEQENKDFQAIMSRVSTDASEQFDADFDLLLRDPDVMKRTAARNLKNRMEAMEKEVLFHKTDAEIKREQLKPFKDKCKTMEGQTAELNYKLQEQSIRLGQQEDLIGEQQRQIDLLREKAQSTLQSGMTKPRPKVAGDREVLQENHSGCTKDDGCMIF